MRNISLLRFLLVTALACVAPGSMALPDFGSKMKGMMPKGEATEEVVEESGSDGSEELSAADAQESIVSEFREIIRDVTIAQSAVVKALGIKDEAAAVEADANAISGECDNKCLDEAIARSAELNEKIETALANSESMKNVSKEEAGKAALPWLKAGYRTAKYVPKLSKWGKSATAEIKEAGMMGAPKMKKKFSQGLFIVRKAPPAAKKWITTIKLMQDVFKKNNISIEGADDFDF